MSYSLESLNTLLLEVQKWNPAKVIANEEFCYLDLGCVDKDNKVILKDHVLPMLGKDAPSRAKQIVKKRDVLVSTVRPNLNGVAMVKEDYKYATASTGYCVLRVKQSLNADYLFYWVRTKDFISDMEAKATGASYPAVSDKIIKESRIPLPPLEEQKKIAAILDAADDYRQKTKALIEKYDQLTQSLFLDMFGDPVTNPMGWKFSKIENILHTKTQNGYYAPKDEYIDNGIQMVHMSDAFYRKVIPGNLKTIKADSTLISKYELRATDLLISRRSLTYEGAAQPCLIPKYDKPLIYESSLIRLRPKLNTCNTNYLFHFLNNTRARQKYVFKHVTRSTISGINNKGLNAILLYLPPITLQNQFAERVAQIEKQKQQAEASLVKAEELFSSLLQRAFKGELTS